MSTRMSSGPSIARDRGDVRRSVSLTSGFEHAKASYRYPRYQALAPFSCWETLLAPPPPTGLGEATPSGIVLEYGQMDSALLQSGSIREGSYDDESIGQLPSVVDTCACCLLCFNPRSKSKFARLFSPGKRCLRLPIPCFAIRFRRERSRSQRPIRDG